MKNSILNHYGLYLVILLFVTAALIILPKNNHPYNDDWAYASMTKTFLDTGEIRFINWGEPTLLSHILWGSLFCIATGFSFTALQLSVWIWAVTGVVSFYCILNYFNVDESQALVGVSLFSLNPIYFMNSFTYMTDAAFMGQLLLSLLLYLYYLKSKRLIYILLCGFFSIFAFLNRQHAIILPFLFCVHGFFGLSEKRLWRQVFFWAGLVPFTAMFIGLVWRFTRDNIFMRSLSFSPTLSASIFYKLVMYTGLFTSIMVVPFILARSDKKLLKRLNLYILITFLFLVVLLAFTEEKMMPLLHNNITVYGQFDINEILPGQREFMFPRPFWIGITLISAFSASVLLITAISKLKALTIHLSHNKDHLGKVLVFYLSHPMIVLYASALFFLLFPVLTSGAFDRYVIMFLPGVLLFVLKSMKPMKNHLVWIGMLLFSLFSASIIYDTLEWNWARWFAAKQLVSQGIPPTAIDAGFEWCGWYAEKPVGQVSRKPASSYYTSYYLKKYFSGIDNRYCVAFSHLQGFQVIDRIKYNSVPWKKNRWIYTLSRNPE